MPVGKSTLVTFLQSVSGGKHVVAPGEPVLALLNASCGCKARPCHALCRAMTVTQGKDGVVSSTELCNQRWQLGFAWQLR